MPRTSSFICCPRSTSKNSIVSVRAPRPRSSSTIMPRTSVRCRREGGASTPSERGAGRELAVELVLDRLRHGEGELPGSSDLDGFAIGRVAAFARGRVLHLELPEPVEAHFLALGGSLRDRREDKVDRLAGIRLGRARLAGEGLGELTIIHSNGPSWQWKSLTA